MTLDSHDGLRFLPETRELLNALKSGTFNADYGVDIAESVESAKEIVTTTIEFVEQAGASDPWIGYLAIEESTNRVVGSCGFKGGPDAEGNVEIAYFTFPRYVGRGMATRMARGLVAIARDAAPDQRVIAHTLPEPNASTKVLEKVGFTYESEVDHPEDGLVWRWRYTGEPSG